MRIVTTPEATQLTGLSTETLREWTSRRALIRADVLPKGKGTPAGYTWQTILIIRIAVALRDRFRLELEPHRRLFASLQSGLQQASFIALWDKALALRGDDDWALVGDMERHPMDEDVLIIHLRPHLEAVSVRFALPRPSKLPGQLELFPARSLDPTTHRPIDPVAGKQRPDPIRAMRQRSA